MEGPFYFSDIINDMENTPDSGMKFSYPNAGQDTPGITDSSKPKDLPTEGPTSSSNNFSNTPGSPNIYDANGAPVLGARKSVNIFEALESQKREDKSLARIKTYQEDIADAMKHDNLSMIQVAMAEKKRQEREGSIPSAPSEQKSKKPIIIGAVSFIAVIILGMGYFMFQSYLSTKTIAEDQAVQAALLYTEEKVSINIYQKDSDDITRLIKREVDAPLEFGTMKALAITNGIGTSTKEVSIEDFLTALGARSSSSLIRSFDPQFLLGMYSFTPKDFFILIKVNSYDSAFAGMLQWEPDMETDLGNFMITHKPILSIAALTQPKISTSTSATSSAPINTSPFGGSGRVWVDRVVNNKDSRVLIDSDGSPAMLYTFVDEHNLVIASSDKALKEIMFRLTSGRVAR